MRKLLRFSCFFACMYLFPWSAFAQQPPIATVSYYMSCKSTKPSNTTQLYPTYNLGCKQAQKDIRLSSPQYGIVILDYGDPYVESSTFGPKYGTTIVFHPECRRFTSEDIEFSAFDYAKGYNDCAGNSLDPASFLSIVLSLNNDGTNFTPELAQAWGIMINDLNSELTLNGYARFVTATGGIDAEPGYTSANPKNFSAQATRDWVDAYGSVSYGLINFGSADGCPPAAPNPP